MIDKTIINRIGLATLCIVESESSIVNIFGRRVYFTFDSKTDNGHIMCCEIGWQIAYNNFATKPSSDKYEVLLNQILELKEEFYKRFDAKKVYKTIINGG